MTERELIYAAKVFQGNCGANGDKISFGESCKVVLLARLVDNSRNFTISELELLLQMIRNKKPWYKI